MNVRVCATCAIALTLLSVALGASPERTVSTSRQFILYGTDVALRGAISHLAEETKMNLLGILRRPDSWKTPIVINLQFPQANVPEIPPAALHFSQTGAGLKLQLDLIIAVDVNNAAIERELLRAILLEMIYRNQPNLAPGTVYVDPPDWLLDGTLVVAVGRDPKPLVDALEPFSAAEKIASLSEFLRERPALLDSPARLLYRAYSAAFVRWLIDEPEGRSHLGRYIDNLSRASNDPLADLKIYFPALNGDSVEKKWQAHVAQFCRSQSYQLLTFEETQRRLDELLTIRFENLSQGKISPAQSKALARLNQNLMLLKVRAHPVLRPSVAEYEQIAALLTARKSVGVSERLARLQVLRAKIAARMSKIDDYMNWFEATQARTKSGAFADYFKAVEAQNEVTPRRHDAISVYLDALEEQFHD